MSLKPSAVLASAKRIQLTSKSGNKNFYKGTGSDPSLGPKRQGRHTRLLGDPRGHIKGAYRLQHKRMRTFVVPRGTPLATGNDSYVYQWDTDLRPYVSKMTTSEMLDAAEAEWPRYGPRGFDGHYALRLMDHLYALSTTENGVTHADKRSEERQRLEQGRRRQESESMGSLALARARQDWIAAPWERRRDAEGQWDDVRPMVQGPVDRAVAEDAESAASEPRSSA